jgi:hypothetical protein
MRVKRIRTASDTVKPTLASFSAASVFSCSSTRTWSIEVRAIGIPDGDYRDNYFGEH